MRLSISFSLLTSLLFLLPPIGHSIKPILEDIQHDYCHECEYPHYNGPRPDQYTTLSCVRQMSRQAPRERVQYYLRENPICIALVIFDKLKPLYTIRTAVPASALPEQCYRHRLTGGFYFPTQTVTIDDRFGMDPHWQSEEGVAEDYDTDPWYNDDDASTRNLKTHNYTGALRCCGTPMCNSDDVEFYVPTRIFQKEDEDKDFNKVLPMVITVGMIMITLWPFISQLANSNRKRLREHVERARDLLDEWIDIEMPQNIRYRDRESVAEAVFPASELGLKWMQQVFRRLSKNVAPHPEPVDPHFSVEPPLIVHNYRICNTVYSKVLRKTPTRQEDLLTRLVEHGPFEYDFNPLDMAELFDQSIQTFEQEPSLLRLGPNTVIVGSIDGDYVQLFRIFMKFGWPPDQRYLFLGNVTHPDVEQSLETLCLLLALKRAHPDWIYVLRGVSETEGINVSHRFSERLSNVIANVTNEVHSRFPLGAVIAGKIFCVHGGIPPKLTLSKISQLHRRSPSVEEDTLDAALIFSVPDPIRNHRINGGRGWYFNSEVASRFLYREKLLAIIRSRNPVNSGLHVEAAQKELYFYTIHSSPLPLRDGNKKSACILYVSKREIIAARFTQADTLPNVVDVPDEKDDPWQRCRQMKTKKKITGRVKPSTSNK